MIRGASNLLDASGDLPDGHKLHNLWDTARPLLKQAFGDQEAAFKQVAGVVESLRTLDPEGDAFRYPVTTKRTSNAGRRQPTIDLTLRHLDLTRLYDDVSRVLDLLYGAETGIDAFADYKAEQEAEHRQYREEVNAEMAAEYADYYHDEY